MEQEPKRKKLVVGVTVLPETQARVADLAVERDWSIAQAGDFLIRLGLQKLDELKASQEAAKPIQLAA